MVKKLTMKSIIDKLRGSDQYHSQAYILLAISTPGMKWVQKLINSLWMLNADLSPWPKLYTGFDLLPIKTQHIARKLGLDWTLLHKTWCFRKKRHDYCVVIIVVWWIELDLFELETVWLFMSMTVSGHKFSKGQFQPQKWLRLRSFAAHQLDWLW